MHDDRNLLRKQLTVLVIFTIVGFAFRFLPYWKEEHEGWLLGLWGANAVLPLFMLTVSRCQSLAWAYALPMAGFVISDLLIQWILSAQGKPTSSLTARLFFYGLFMALAQLGLVLRFLKLNRLQTVLSGVGLTLLGSCLFFLVTNFLIWMKSSPADGMYYYPPDWTGLIKCFEMAWPFFKNQFMGDAIFSFAFLGIYGMLEQKYFVTKTQLVPIST